MNILAVGLGGAVGSIARYLIGLIHIHENSVFPIKTFIINILGCALIALISILGIKDSQFMLFLKTGICGGFTTFSTFALESGNLLRDGHPAVAVSYMALSVLTGVVAVMLIQYSGGRG